MAAVKISKSEICIVLFLHYSISQSPYYETTLCLFGRPVVTNGHRLPTFPGLVAAIARYICAELWAAMDCYYKASSKSKDVSCQAAIYFRLELFGMTRQGIHEINAD